MRTWFILLRRGEGGREEFRSCKRETEEEARGEGERLAVELAEVYGEPVVVGDVRVLRGSSR